MLIFQLEIDFPSGFCYPLRGVPALSTYRAALSTAQLSPGKVSLGGVSLWIRQSSNNYSFCLNKLVYI